MTMDPEIYTLPSDPRANACGAFFDALKAHRGKPVHVDASAVDRMDTLVAQVMVIGARTWAADEVPFAITNPSEVVITGLARLGLTDAVEIERTEHVD